MPETRPIPHDFRHEAFDAINDSPRQRSFRALAPMPFGSVLIARDEMDEEEIRWHFRTMKSLGFNAIKQFMPSARWSNATLEKMALEEGLVAWWYGEGGWEPVTPELCERLGIDPNLSREEIHAHPAMQAHQRAVLEKRIGRPKLKLNPEAQEGMFKQEKASVAAAYGANADLPEWAVDEFVDWLRGNYQDDLEALNQAWNTDVFRVKSKEDPGTGFQSWDELRDIKHCGNKRDYGRVRDVLRFKADLKNRDVALTAAQALERDPHEPHRSGGEMGLFLPFASRGTDMEGIARAMKDCGSFYPSIHLCWHFEESDFEVARPVYMQASFVVDLNKGGWTAPWESTGGPQQTSGSTAPLYPPARDKQPGYTVDAGVMSQLLFSYLAAGCKGAGLWSWNARFAGVEAGEYALLDRNEKVCERTRHVGRISQAANRWRDELWQAHKEPLVGILVDWDNEAVWAAMSEFNRTVFKHFPVEARMGASRACIDASIPYEYVTATNLREGLASRYPVIYLPGFLGLHPGLLTILQDYVRQGGRVVADMPAGCYTDRGRVMRTATGSPFEQLFGVELSDLQYSGNNVRHAMEGQHLHGYTADLIPTTAKVAAEYGHGAPAVTENELGAGTAVLLGWEAARACKKPGNPAMQELLTRHLLGTHAPWFACEGEGWAYRLAAPDADHYFLLTEGDRTLMRFTRLPHAYADARDVLDDAPVNLDRPIEVPRNGGRWIRCEKTDQALTR